MPSILSKHALTAAAVAAAMLPIAAVTAPQFAAPASAATACSGTIAVTAATDGSSLGSLSTRLVFGLYQPATTGPFETFTLGPELDDGVRQITVATGSTAHPRLGAMIGNFDTTLGSGSDGYTWVTQAGETPAGATPQRVPTSVQDQASVANGVESAIWAVDPTTDGSVSSVWVNADGFSVPTQVFRYNSENWLGTTGDFDTFIGRTGQGSATAVDLVFVPAQDADCGFATPQVIAFDEGTTTTGFVGRTATVTATGGDSGNPVTFSSNTPGVCTVEEDGEVAYLATGTCTIAADQDGTEAEGDDPGYADAETATTEITVSEEPSTTALSATADPVVGQDVELTVEVFSDDGAADPTPAGTVQFLVDDAVAGEPVPVEADGTATYDAGPLTKGTHNLDAVFTPADNGAVLSSSDGFVITVAAADTTTALTVGRRQVEAQVTVDEPGAGTPTGEVVFTVDSVEIGRAPLVDGVATLDQSVPSGAERGVAATYTGSDDFNGSSDSTDRTDPVVTTTVTSPEPQTNGWYTAPVTVTFDCADDDAALTKPCPAPVTRSRRGADITVTRTIRALDGGTTTVTETFSIDKRGPFLSFAGVEPRTVYPNGVPARARCTAVDDLSGVDADGCTLRKRRVEGTNRVVLTATATDVAGNPSRKSIVVFVPRRGADRTAGPLG